MKGVKDAGLILGCLLSVTAVVLAFQGVGAADGSGRQPPAIEDLIKQLGSDRFEVREEATQLLSEREEAAPALRAALKSPDSEIASRAATILDRLVKKAKKRAFARLSDLANNGEIDQAIELFVRWKEWDNEDDCWQVITDLNRRLLELEAKQFGWAIFRKSDQPEANDLGLPPIFDFRRFVKAQKPDLLIDNRVVIKGRAVARGKEIIADDPRFNNFGALFVASDSVKSSFLNICIVHAGQSVEAKKLRYCVVFCDGDVTVTQSIDRAMIIARGAVRCPKDVRWSHIISSGKVEFPKDATVTETKVQENEATPLGFVKFFDPGQHGVVVELAQGGLRVKTAEEDKPFAKAGLRAGDLIVEADSQAVGTPDELRRMLRRRVVVGEELSLKVRRENQTLELVIPFRL